MDRALEKRVGKNSLAIYGGRLANLIINLAAFVYLANYLGETLYGRLSFVLTYVGFFDILVNAGCNQILVRELAKGEIGRERILGTGLWLRGISLVIGMFACWACILALRYPAEVVYLVLIVSVNLLVSSRIASARSFFETVFQADLRMTLPMSLIFVDNLIFLGLVFWGGHRGAGVSEMAVAYTASNFFGFAVLAGRFFRENTVTWRFDPRLASRLLSQSIPVMLYLAFSNLNTRLDVLLVSLLRDDAEVGLYTSATRLVLPLTLLSTPITMSLFPVYSRAYRSDRMLFDRVLSTGLKLLLLLGLAIAAGLYFNGAWIYGLLYRQEYWAAAPAFSLIAVALGLMFLTFYLVEILIGVGRQHLATVTMFSVLTCNVCLNWILIQRGGYMGAAYTRLATALLSAVLFGLLVGRCTGTRLFRDMPRVAAVVGGTWFAAYAARGLFPPLQIVLVVGAMAAMVAITGYFRPREWELLARFVGRSEAQV
ncbi:MAG: flippase [candidate division KSB1 bacterium]|nr:flippase [candidate division KSB1 bacterium]